MEIRFDCHPKFSEELDKFCHKHPTTNIDLKHLCNLLSIHFNPEKPTISITPKNLKRVDRVGANITVYKVNMAVQGISKGQCPRVYFWLETGTITFLCMDSHIDNYDDAKLKEKAKQRIMEMNPNVRL